MKTPENNIDIGRMYQVANDMLAFAKLLRDVEIDPNGTLALTSNNLMTWSSIIIYALELKEKEGVAPSVE